MLNFTDPFKHLFRVLLRACYAFDKWHLALFSDRPYAAAVVDYLNARLTIRNDVVEIGAGLGDIIRRIHCGRKTILDKDEKVLQACKLLTRLHPCGEIAIERFEFPSSKLKGDFDAVIAVNWLHNIPPSELKSGLQTIFRGNIRPGGILIFDVVENLNYKFNHDPNYLLESLNCRSEEIGRFEYGRRVIAACKRGAND